MSVNLDQTTPRHSPKDSTLYSNLRQNLRFQCSLYLSPNHVVYKQPVHTDNKTAIMYVMTF